MAATTLTRRRVLKTATLASTAFAMPLVHGAFAAGKLSCGFWDHWVPTATAPLEQLCREWAAKEKVDITVDFITANGDKDLLTMAAEGQAKSGHDILQIGSWYATSQAENLEPVDDVVTAILRSTESGTHGAALLSMRAATQRCVRSPRSYGALWNKFASIAAEPRDHAVHQQRIICGTVDLGDRDPVLDAGPGPAPGERDAGTTGHRNPSGTRMTAAGQWGSRPLRGLATAAHSLDAVEPAPFYKAQRCALRPVASVRHRPRPGHARSAAA